MLRVAIIGLGKMGQRHAEAWHALEDVEIAGLVGRNQEKITVYAEQYQTAFFPDIETLLEQQRIDVVDICLPTFLHYDAITRAINKQADIQIVCEKPLCLTREEAKKILKLTQKYRTPIFVGHILRFDPEYRALHNQVKAGAVGEVGIVRLTRKTAFPGGWFHDAKQSGGIVMDLGIHDIDWLLWTFGDIERIMSRHMKVSKERTFEYALITLRMKSGVIAHLELSWGAKQLESSVEIAGKDGLLLSDGTKNQPIAIELHHTNNTETNYLSADVVGEAPIVTQLRHFKNCILHGEKPIITVEEAARAVAVVEDAILSGEKKDVIYVEGDSQ